VHQIFRAFAGEQADPPTEAFESSNVEWVPLSDVPILAGHGEISSGTTLASLLYVLAEMSTPRARSAAG
jgi:hypothetical protein